MTVMEGLALEERLGCSFAIERKHYSYRLLIARIMTERIKWAVREMIWAGKLPYVKDGKRILLDIYDMDEWIEKNKTRFSKRDIDKWLDTYAIKLHLF